MTIRDEPAEYVRWASTEPDNRNGLEHCGILVMGPWGRGRFVDGDCHSTTGIIEWEQPVHVLCRFDGPKPPPPTLNPIELEVCCKFSSLISPLNLRSCKNSVFLSQQPRQQESQHCQAGRRQQRLL